ncbi:hypothetical protein A2U01_0007528, partial [Trifolium medium]|nr:hypothetical protein [Trifolium medium]
MLQYVGFYVLNGHTLFNSDRKGVIQLCPERSFIPPVRFLYRSDFNLGGFRTDIAAHCSDIAADWDSINGHSAGTPSAKKRTPNKKEEEQTTAKRQKGNEASKDDDQASPSC